MNTPMHRAPQAGKLPSNAPHAALLIDFDNVTMGIRSDLTKELKSLLNSDIIKGKVAVQRAYADWRRYPQYIVPLSEASVDLIFAPAYGSSKKNATDIRLAIDAIELVFSRPEIGTIILLSGDSDFSSLVLKLKEYGKYVIGVGIRESASDLLVQNCDEYYSYSALTGLTRTSEQDAAATAHDPWELVELAIRQMEQNNDVMRSDRMKQVMVELDPSFDEKDAGFTKFNRFVQEAASRGIIRLNKMENGQFEVEPAGEPRAGDEPRRSGSRGGRGRSRRGERERPAPVKAEAKAEDQAAAQPPAAEEARPARGRPAPEPAAEEKRREAPPAAERSRDERSAQPAAERSTGRSREGLQGAYDLLRKAAFESIEEPGGAVRDSDLKRRMLELEPGWDESAFGFSKFSRFLRQAHDAEVINLRKVDSGNYDVMLGQVEDVEEEAAPRGRRGGGERGGRQAAAEKPAEPVKREEKPAEKPAVRPEVKAAEKPEPKAAEKPAEQAQPKPAAQPAAAAAPGTAAKPAGAGRRRGASRGAPADGPPPILPGQAVGKAGKTPAAPATAGEPAARGGSDAGAAVVPATRAAAPDRDLFGAVPDQDPDALVARLVRHKGVGEVSVRNLIEAFGKDAPRVLTEQPERVREVVGPRRGDRIIEAWKEELANPAAGAAAPSSGRSRRGGRRGGRGRGGAGNGGAGSEPAGS
ncbi:MAG: NYN domain-containing protein [Gemmatimonadota bacterium]